MYKNFHDFDISDKVLVCLSEMGFEEPTPIQKAAIPQALKGKDIIGQAQTGTGKTAAFGIPLLEQRPPEQGPGASRYPYALVLTPTRELAVQVCEEMGKIGARTGVCCLPVYGGQSIELQIRSLKKGAGIVVGTPGRILDHIRRKTLVLREIRTVVLDEADEMLNMGFIEDIKKILGEIPEERQTMLFSATMPGEILAIAKNYMKKPVHVSVDAGQMVVARIKQVFYEVRDEDKIKALTRLLDVEGPALTLVFCHTKKEVDEVAGKLQQMGYPAGAIHGDFTQGHRDEMMRKFKKGEIDILVATDVAARGLDVPDVSHVINFSIPQDPEGYIHRIGRTGRAGKPGIAITLVTPRQYRQLRLIEQSAKTLIRKEKLPGKAEVEKARQDDLAAGMEEIIAGGKHAALYPLADRLSEKHSARDIAAAAMHMVLGDVNIEEIEEIRSGYDEGKKDHIRLFMTIGRKDRIKVEDIVRSIAAEANIPVRKIGKIALYETFSFVEVPAGLADRVIGAVNDSIIKGRKVKIGPARKKA
ncbi:MAG: DEAD/DEAH box helicase [Nitrospiraceae bacterium]|nr:DEAD/DEAH box helicase [Nitrospiraceae bacterium]